MKRIVVITQNESLVREGFGQRLYRKICTGCGIGLRARAKNKRTCPRCGERLRKATEAELATDR